MQVLEIASSSVAVKLTETVCPASAGLGETLVMVTVGVRSFTVRLTAVEVVDLPAASVALAVILKILDATPPALYTWVKGAVQELLPSPKLTQVFDIASSSEALTVTVTVAPSFAGLGETLVIETVGARSFTVRLTAVEVVERPAASVAFAVILKIFDATPPVL